MRWLLERTDEGVTLTQTHRLKPATVTAMTDTFGWDDGFSRRKLEDDFREVVATENWQKPSARYAVASCSWC